MEIPPLEIMKAKEGMRHTPGRIHEFTTPSGRKLKKMTSKDMEYAVSQGVIRFDSFMNIVVRDPHGYRILQEISSILKSREDAEQKAMEEVEKTL